LKEKRKTYHYRYQKGGTKHEIQKNIRKEINLNMNKHISVNKYALPTSKRCLD
jgi:hypothetical protein